ncbi:MAG: dihydrodipicolinate synthase family protein [Anaerolineaceae bacterium]|nr:dihydrodipicolinate synthase family protein [Anaerolineaceae bacterium]MDE0328870.1 dihydrodipicolinate synthase family protein [Anaerolineaceae bacterium]
MAFSHSELLDALDSVNSIPLIPFDGGRIDCDGHARNVDYLMGNNHLSGGRPRVIGLAGTSLVHHIRPEEHLRLVDITGRQMGAGGLLLAALVPNPLSQAGDFVDQLMDLSRPPDVFLIMPLTGTFSPEGLYGQLLEFTVCYGERHGARFLYYYRSARDRDAILRLLKDSPHMVGVKIGTEVADVPAFVEGVGAERIVIWGVGDRSTAAAELGARGHTSGINIVFARASDAINNAQRCGDYAAARQVEAIIDPLEQLRFVNGRAWNYAVVAEAIRLGGFGDVVAGDGAPFNPRVPQEISAQIGRMVADLRAWH